MNTLLLDVIENQQYEDPELQLVETSNIQEVARRTLIVLLGNEKLTQINQQYGVTMEELNKDEKQPSLHLINICWKQCLMDVQQFVYNVPQSAKYYDGFILSVLDRLFSFGVIMSMSANYLDENEYSIMIQCYLHFYKNGFNGEFPRDLLQPKDIAYYELDKIPGRLYYKNNQPIFCTTDNKEYNLDNGENCEGQFNLLEQIEKIVNR